MEFRIGEIHCKLRLSSISAYDFDGPLPELGPLPLCEFGRNADAALSQSLRVPLAED
ncbi:hypothetical protein ACTGJ9_017150 [Bradyrhizobium sp. RDM12]